MSGITLKRTLGPLEEDILAIDDLACLLAVLTASPEAENAIDGIRWIALDISDRAKSVHRSWQDAVKIAQDLERPDTEELSEILAGNEVQP
jgi:hypothetical protein